MLPYPLNPYSPLHGEWGENALVIAEICAYYAVDPHPKSFSLRAKDFLIRERVSCLSLREDNILVRKVS